MRSGIAVWLLWRYVGTSSRKCARCPALTSPAVVAVGVAILPWLPVALAGVLRGVVSAPEVAGLNVVGPEPLEAVHGVRVPIVALGDICHGFFIPTEDDAPVPGVAFVQGLVPGGACGRNLDGVERVLGVCHVTGQFGRGGERGRARTNLKFAKDEIGMMKWEANVQRSNAKTADNKGDQAKAIRARAMAATLDAGAKTLGDRLVAIRARVAIK